MLARQAQEANPAGQQEEDDDDDDNDEDDDDHDDDLEPFADGRDTVDGDGTDPASEAPVTNSGNQETASDPGTEDELQSVGDASPGGDSISSSGTYASASEAAVATGGSAFSSPQQGRPGGDESLHVDVGMTPPRPPGGPSGAAAVSPPPPPQQPPYSVAGAASAPGLSQGLSMGVGSALAAVAAATVAAGQRVATTASDAARAAAAAGGGGGAAPAPVPEPPRLKALVALLRKLGVPVLELAFFPAEQRSWLVVSDPNEAARGALSAIHALKSTLAPPHPISEVCEARSAAAAGGAEGAAMAAMAELIASGEDHGRDGRGRKLRLRWGALGPEDMDALLQVRR